ncbi:MAG: energy-coupling factor transporter transmembrane component T family protein [Clostridia bacterium]|jgi:cobalt/nickel transport system permease protein
MDIAFMDRMASGGNSFFHQARGIIKMIFCFSLLIAVVLSQNLVKIGGMVVGILGLFILAGIPFRKVLHFTLFPVFFSILFALLKLQQSWTEALMLLLKAVGAALSMIFLITTTSYVEVFGILSIFLPKLLMDVFLFTYRSFFILLEKIDHLLKSIRLRGGYRSWNLILNLRSIAGAIGVMIIHSFDMNERMYHIYSLRGYRGGIPFHPRLWPWTRDDGKVMIIMAIFFVWMVIPWNI